MKKIFKVLSIMVSLVLGLGGVSTIIFANAKVEINILATSDLHGRIYPVEYATGFEINGGLGKVATIVKEERAKDSELLLIDNGDTIESNMINIFNGDEIHPMIKTMNAMNYDIWTLGNHEFNFGLEVLNKAITSFEGDVLVGNIINTEDNSTFVKPYIIKEIKGVKIGILSLTTPHVKRWESNPDNYKGLDFLDPFEIAKKYADILLNEENVDVLIGTFHFGLESQNFSKDFNDSAREIAEKIEGFDAIITGHAHSTFGELGEEKTYNGTKLIAMSSTGKYVGKINIKLEKFGNKFKVINVNTDLITTIGVEADQEILDLMKYVDDKSTEEANTVVGFATSDFLQKEIVKGIPVAQVQDTAVIDLINKVQMIYSGADVSGSALLDSRATVKEGELTFKDIALLYKYSNTLEGYNITGAKLKEYLEWSARYYNTQKKGDVNVSFNPNIRGYNYDMFSGIDYEIDLSKPVGERVINIIFNGNTLEDDTELKIAMNNYRAGVLKSLGILKDDMSDMYFDSTTLAEPEMQRLIQKYVSEKEGNLEPIVDNNWKLIGISKKELGHDEALRLINEGIISLPRSEDGRTRNVKSINVLDVPTKEEIQNIADNLEIPVEFLGNPKTNGELYIEAVEILDDVIQFIGFNDYHGIVDEGIKNPGMAKFVTVIKEKKENNPNTVVVSSGDNYNGTAMSNLLYGAPMTELFKEIELEFSAVGNHEFDWGVDKISPWAKDGGFEFLAANIVYKDTNKPIKWAKPYAIKEIDGFKVGIIGLSTIETAYKTNPNNVENLIFINTIEATEKYVAVLKEKGVDAILLLTHIGAFQNKETREVIFEVNSKELSKVEGIDGIITGHTHQIIDGIKNGVPIVQGYYNGRTLAEIKFIRDKDSGEFVTVGSLDNLYLRKDDINHDKNAQKIYNKYFKEVAPTINEELSILTIKLDHNSRQELSTLGQWTTDVMKNKEGVDISVTNAGGLRRSLEAGTVTMGDLYEVMPYDNVHAIYEMTGKQVRELFEYGLSSETIKNVGKIQFSGVKIEIDGDIVNKIVLDDGSMLDDNKIYKVVTNDFMGNGGDGYTIFKEAKLLGETLPIRDAMVEELRKKAVLDYKKINRLFKIGDLVIDKVEIKPDIPSTQVIYSIRDGDTLGKIALLHSTKTWEELAQINNIKNADIIYFGQKIII